MESNKVMELSARRLKNGDALPDLTLPRVGGGTTILSQYLKGAWGVVLFYRGDWCPFCNAQLSGFQRKLKDLDTLGARVVAISVDSQSDASKTVERSHLTYPVLYGADVTDVAARFGAYSSADAHGTYINSTGFIVDPNGDIALVVYSSGAIGRIVADDAVGLVGYLTKMQK